MALGLTLGVAPRTNRIYYDEQIYQNTGQNLADLKRAQMCNDGTIEDGRLRCARGEYNKQPYAYPHLLSLVYRVFGVGTTTGVCRQRHRDGADRLCCLSARRCSCSRIAPPHSSPRSCSR